MVKLFDEQDIVPIDTEHTINNGQNPFKTKCGNINVKYLLSCEISFDGIQTISKIDIMNEWSNTLGSITIQDVNSNDLKTYKLSEKN